MRNYCFILLLLGGTCITNAESLPKCSTLSDAKLYDSDADCFVSALHEGRDLSLTKDDLTPDSFLYKFGLRMGDEIEKVSYSTDVILKPKTDAKSELSITFRRPALDRLQTIKQPLLPAATEPDFAKAEAGRREAIRQKFVDAIKAAAQRRDVEARKSDGTREKFLDAIGAAAQRRGAEEQTKGTPR